MYLIILSHYCIMLFSSEQSKMAESLDQSHVDRTMGVYSWKDWVAMATIHRYNIVQTTVQPTYQ